MTEDIAPRAPDRLRLTLAAAVLLAAGGIAGGVAGHAIRPPVEMAPLHPVAIRTLPGVSGIVTVRGRVAETYGHAFVIDDGSARTLVDTGPQGDRTALVADGQTVTVQGRFDRGIMHASFLVDPAGTVTALAPPAPPHDGHGPHRGPDAVGPPPPPPAAAPIAPPVAD